VLFAYSRSHAEQHYERSLRKVCLIMYLFISSLRSDRKPKISIPKAANAATTLDTYAIGSSIAVIGDFAPIISLNGRRVQKKP
jgi:hypothetical protein